jgi:hypothetical protein
VWLQQWEQTLKADGGARGDPDHFRKIYEAAQVRRQAAIDGRELTTQEKIKVSEARGELNSFFAIESLKGFENYKQVQSFGKGDSHNFDGVWEDQKGNILIVESKGGDSRLAEYPDVGRQMSYDWLVARAKTLGPPIGDKILKALNSADLRVQGIVVRTPKQSGAGAVVETTPSKMQGIEDVDPNTGLIDYSATHKRR